MLNSFTSKFDDEMLPSRFRIYPSFRHATDMFDKCLDKRLGIFISTLLEFHICNKKKKLMQVA